MFGTDRFADDGGKPAETFPSDEQRTRASARPRILSTGERSRRAAAFSAGSRP